MTDDAATDVARATKSQLRSEVRARIAAMSSAERSRADHRICGYLAELAADVAAQCVLGYLALRDEARVDGFLASMVEAGRTVMLPRVVDGGLRYRGWLPSARLSRDDAGVLAPAAASGEDWRRGTALIVVAGRAFDRAGGRVGRGRGYYDRLLAESAGRDLVVGAAYECQVVERIPREAHDRDVDCLVTETGCHRFRAGAGGIPGRRG